MNKKLKDKVGAKGEYQFVSLSKELKEEKIQEILPRIRIAIRNNDEIEIEKLKKEKVITDIKKVSNIVPTVGRNVLNKILSGDFTYTGEINYGALGTGTTAFTNATTQLNTETFRKLKASSSETDNFTWVDWFIADGDVANGTFEEFGAFIDGTASANTGQIFSALITGGWVKTSSVFISLKITLT